MLKPLGARVIVKPDDIEETDPTFRAAKQAGIHIPRELDAMKREQQAVVKGTVVSIGELAFHAPVGNGIPWVKTGDRVYYAKYAGKEVVDPETDEKLLLLNDEDLCVEVTGEK